jgi:CubicO group peptidase (beta-lactamase class C family)
MMTSPATLPNGKPPTYGDGLLVGESLARAAIFHGGGISGFKAWLIYYPEDDLSVALLSNTLSADNSLDVLATQIAAEMLAGSDQGSAVKLARMRLRHSPLRYTRYAIRNTQ